jgi:hypothetical protein
MSDFAKTSGSDTLEHQLLRHKRDIPHEAFRQPENAGIAVWRYLTLPKFLSLVTERALPLVRADKLGDAFEGSVPKGYGQEVLRIFAEDAKRILRELVEKGEWPREANTEEMEQQLAPQIKVRRLAYVRGSHISCWRWGNESEAMWRLYCGPEAGVAIVTSYQTLKRSLTPDPATRAGLVNYIDFESESLPSLNFMHPLMHKRAAFAHEQEVRVVRFLEAEVRELMIPEPQKLPPVLRFVRPWNPEDVLERVVVSPYAADWYFETIRSVLCSVSPALGSKLTWSTLRADPVY